MTVHVAVHVAVRVAVHVVVRQAEQPRARRLGARERHANEQVLVAAPRSLDADAVAGAAESEVAAASAWSSAARAARAAVAPVAPTARRGPSAATGRAALSVCALKHDEAKGQRPSPYAKCLHGMARSRFDLA